MKIYSFSDLPFDSRSADRRRFSRITFPNGYEASVITGDYSFGGHLGLYELAVLRDGDLVYDTPITNDVLGHLNEDEVGRYLNEIARLPERTVPHTVSGSE